MSLEAWGDESPDSGWVDDEVERRIRAAFVLGLQMMREYASQEVLEYRAHPNEILTLWRAEWGDDPGEMTPATFYFDPWSVD